MLESIEKFVRRAAGAGMLVFMIMLYLGLWRGLRRAKGRTSGLAPKVLQGLLSFYALVPVSAIGLGLLYLLWRPLRLTLSVPLRVAALIAGAALYFPGLALMLWGRLALGEMYSVSSGLGAQLYADHRLVTSGPFAFVRHPMYLGGQLAELGAFLIYRNWATMFIALSAPALMLRAKWEEEALEAQFGTEWTEYCRHVPFWIPCMRR